MPTDQLAVVETPTATDQIAERLEAIEQQVHQLARVANREHREEFAGSLARIPSSSDILRPQGRDAENEPTVDAVDVGGTYGAFVKPNRTEKDIRDHYVSPSRQAHREGRLRTALLSAEAGLGVIAHSSVLASAASETEIHLLYRLGELWQDIRHIRVAQEYLDKAIALRTQFPRWPNEDVPLAQLLRARATLHVLQGEWDCAENDFDQAFASVRQVQDRSVTSNEAPDMKHVESIIANALCWFRRRQGRFEDALEQCDLSIKLKDEFHLVRRPTAGYPYQQRAEIILALIRLGRESPDRIGEADTAINEALHLFNLSSDKRGSDRRNLAGAHLTRARVLAQQGAFEEAMLEVSKANTYGESEKLAYYQIRAHRAWGGIHAMRGEFSDACRAFDRALELFEKAEVDDRYERALVKRERGKVYQNDPARRGHAKRELVEAREEFLTVGAEWEAEQTEALLATSISSTQPPMHK